MGDPSVCVFGASPLLTVTVEADAQGCPEVHVHAGGQGFWVARMVAELGVRVRLCGAFGGESGRFLPEMMREVGVEVLAAERAGSNGAYVQDRRNGQRQQIVEMPATPLSRHDLDNLYSLTLAEAMESDVLVLSGTRSAAEMPAETYSRLASDVRRLGAFVVGDLSGEPLQQAVEGGLTVLKASDEDLVSDELAASRALPDLVETARAFARRGVRCVVISRAAEPALALVEGRLLTAEAPSLNAVEHRGAGDSMTAAIAAALARKAPFDDAIRLGVAAGAANVTRRGLATGHRPVIEQLAARVELRELEEM
ncbi:MAG TPA: PfkB family carbohydrate kinase [Actinomycetales bacterium]|nr:PfkB family carbohydrate kinase [Actinomycetales bacterium]